MKNTFSVLKNHLKKNDSYIVGSYKRNDANILPESLSIMLKDMTSNDKLFFQTLKNI